MKEQKKFKALKNGLGNGLICEVNDLKNWNINIDHVEFCVGDKETWECMTPHFFSLNYLTKPIRIEGYNDGKEFVPAIELARMMAGFDIQDEHFNRLYCKDYSELGAVDVLYKTGGEDDDYILGFHFEAMDQIPTWISVMLDKWKINRFNLPESDYIDASKSKVYEPK